MPNLLNFIKFKAPLPTGAYVCIIDSASPINDSRRRGARVTLEVVEGECAGRRADVEFIIGAKSAGSKLEQARINRDLHVLTMWAGALGAGGEGIDTPVALVMALRQAGEGKRVEFTLKRNEWSAGIELVITAVRVLPAAERSDA